MPPGTTAGRENFRSRHGFVLTTAGAAIGLANLWRFPYASATEGGGAFVLLYLVFIALIGLPILLGELALGRHGGKSSVGSFARIAPHTPWPWLGSLGVVACFAILSFYCVIAGWSLGYLFRAMAGLASNASSTQESALAFEHFVGRPWISLSLSALLLFATCLIVRRGVQRGIEESALVLMPIFGALLFLLLARAITLPGASEGFGFLFQVNPGAVNGQMVLDALGQAFFSLSLGMGVMVTYGSYVRSAEPLDRAAIEVLCLNVALALIAAIIVFSIAFSTDRRLKDGVDLLFVVLPSLFGQLPFGRITAVCFYAMLSVSALTSTMAMLESVVAFCVDTLGWQRGISVRRVGFSCFLAAIPSALSLGAVPALTHLFGKGSGFLALLDSVFGNVVLPISAFITTIFIGWRWGARQAIAEFRGKARDARLLDRIWGILIRVACPAAIAIVLANGLRGGLTSSEGADRPRKETRHVEDKGGQAAGPQGNAGKTSDAVERRLQRPEDRALLSEESVHLQGQQAIAALGQDEGARPIAGPEIRLDAQSGTERKDGQKCAAPREKGLPLADREGIGSCQGHVRDPRDRNAESFLTQADEQHVGNCHGIGQGERPNRPLAWARCEIDAAADALDGTLDDVHPHAAAADVAELFSGGEPGQKAQLPGLALAQRLALRWGDEPSIARGCFQFLR